MPTVLIKNEPSIVTPAHGNPKVDSKFSKVIEVGQPNFRPIVKWRQTWNARYFDNDERLNRTVAMSANKFSFIKG